MPTPCEAVNRCPEPADYHKDVNGYLCNDHYYEELERKHQAHHPTPADFLFAIHPPTVNTHGSIEVVFTPIRTYDPAEPGVDDVLTEPEMEVLDTHTESLQCYMSQENTYEHVGDLELEVLRAEFSARGFVNDPEFQTWSDTFNHC